MESVTTTVIESSVRRIESMYFRDLRLKDQFIDPRFLIEAVWILDRMNWTTAYIQESTLVAIAQLPHSVTISDTFDIHPHHSSVHILELVADCQGIDYLLIFLEKYLRLKGL